MTILTTKSFNQFSVWFKALILLLPMAWFILAGPGTLRVFFCGGVIALIELARSGSLRLLWRAWPIPLMVGFYLVSGCSAPEMDVTSQTYGVSAAISTVCYGVPAGFCLALWARKEPGPVLMAFIIYALGLVIAANGVIQAIGPENITKQSGQELLRVNPDSGFVFLGIFKPYNVVIGIIPMTLFAIGSLPWLLLPGWKLHKALAVIAAIAGVYANLLVATRTTLLAAALSSACILALFFYKGAIKRSRMIWLLLVCAVSGVIVANGLDLGSLYAPLSDRLSQLTNDERFYIWKEAAGLLWKNPIGGGINDLKSAEWAHDLFLDFGLTNGWFGIISMLILFGFIFYSILRVIQRTNILTQPVGAILLSAFLASFFTAVTEPPQSSLIAFSYLACCYCLGAENVDADWRLSRQLRNPRSSDKRPKRGDVSDWCIPASKMQ